LKIINVNSSDVKEDVQLLLGLGEGEREERMQMWGKSSFTLFHSIVCHESGGKKIFI
jgi:hypothetical protein